MDQLIQPLCMLLELLIVYLSYFGLLTAITDIAIIIITKKDIEVV